MVKQWFLNGKPVEKTEWSWEVEYKDGKMLKQYDDNGIYHQFREIESDKVKFFYVKREDKAICFLIDKGEKPMFFIRNYLLENGLIKEKVFIFGIENKIYVKAIGSNLVISTKDD